MNYKKIIGWGFTIFAIIYLVMSGFVAYNMQDSWLAKGVGLALVILLALAAGRNTKASLHWEMFKYSVGWTFIVLVLDLILTVPFNGWKIFSQWQIILSYFFLIIMPLFVVKKQIIQETNVTSN